MPPYECRTRVWTHECKVRDISSYDCKESRCPYVYRGMYVHVDMPL